MESHARSIAKAISYRTGGSLITAGIAWGVTRELKFAAAIGLSDILFKTGWYYLHERAWNGIHLGRKKPQDYQI